MHARGQLYFGVIVAHRHVALAHAAADVHVSLGAQRHCSTFGNLGLYIGLRVCTLAVLRMTGPLLCHSRICRANADHPVGIDWTAFKEIKRNFNHCPGKDSSILWRLYSVFATLR